MKKFFFFLILSFAAISFSMPLYAQGAASNTLPDRVQRPMVAIDPVTLQAEGMKIVLWGIKPAQVADTPLELKALDLMDRLIGNDIVNCKVMGGILPEITARCTVRTNEDLGLQLLSHGLAVVDRRQTFNSVFASAYASAQEEARLAERGVWKNIVDKGTDGGVPKWLRPYLPVVVPLVLVVGPFLGLLIASMVIRNWLRRFTRMQQEELEYSRRKENTLAERERQVLVSTLEGELIENKNKIDAFVIVHTDMLRSLQSIEETPKYQQVGDVIQKYPSFSRTVFEANLNRLSLLDMKLAGTISKLYAALPKEPQYINLEPTVALDSAVHLVEKVIADARAFVPALEAAIRQLQVFTLAEVGAMERASDLDDVKAEK